MNLQKNFLEKVRTETFTDSWTKLKNVNLEAAYHKFCKPVKPAPSTKPALILILSSYMNEFRVNRNNNNLMNDLEAATVVIMMAIQIKILEMATMMSLFAANKKK
jgi:hypothetical protein